MSRMHLLIAPSIAAIFPHPSLKMADLPPLRYRRAFRANICFDLPVPNDSEETNRVFLTTTGAKECGVTQKLSLADTLSDEEFDEGIFLFSEFCSKGKKPSSRRYFVAIFVRGCRLEVRGAQLCLEPCEEPKGPKCQPQIPCNAIFEHRREKDVSQFFSCSSCTMPLAIGLQRKGIWRKKWKPSLVPRERAVRSRHVMDMKIDVVPEEKPKDKKPKMHLLTVPLH